MEGVLVCFNFPAMRSHVKGNRKKIIKIQDLKISNIRKSNFARILEKNIQDKFDKIQDWFVGGVAFYNFGSNSVPC